MSFQEIWKIEGTPDWHALQPEFSFSTFLRGNFKTEKSSDHLFNSLQDLLEQLIQKVGARGGLLGYHKSGIQSTISAGITPHELNITFQDQERLKNGHSISKPKVFVHPIRKNNRLAGIIYIFKNPDSWEPLCSELVHAYALLCAKNLQMQHKQEDLAKYANSLVEKKKELEKIQEYNQNLLSITTHDLSSPLNAVSGYLEMVDECMGGDKNRQKIQRYYKQIQSGVNDVSDMLNQLNEVIKFKKGFLTLNKVKVDVNWIVKDICELLQANAAKKEIVLKALPADKPIYVEVDIVKFKRIIYNLVSNAIKYTGRNKHIYVHLQATDHNVQVQVKDEGIGISEDKLDKIFQPFVKLNQGEKPTVKESPGCSQGLGLYISSYFVELMGGRIVARSKTGKGSTFTIILPRVAFIIPQSNTG